MEIKALIFEKPESREQTPLETVIAILFLISFFSLLPMKRQPHRSIVSYIGIPVFTYLDIAVFVACLIFIIINTYRGRKRAAGEILINERAIIINRNDEAQRTYPLSEISGLVLNPMSGNSGNLTFTFEDKKMIYSFRLQTDEQDALIKMKAQWRADYPLLFAPM